MRMRWMIGLLLLLLAASPERSYAAATKDDVAKQEELIYRTNLGRADDVRLLLNDGTSPNQANGDNVPLIVLASSRRDAEGVNVVNALVEGGANINATDPKGRTGLFYAAQNGNSAIVQYLLEHNINYYATDAQGDIARTFAFRAGHKDIVELMDNFVKEQTVKVQEQYKQANKELEKQLLENQQAQQSQQTVEIPVEEKAAAPEEPQPVTVPLDPKEEERLRLQREREEQLRKKMEEERKKRARFESPRFKKAAYDLAFHNCAFQYWSFCRDTKQSTEMTEDELDVAIDSHRDKITGLSENIMDNLGFGPPLINRISTPSKKIILLQLENMPSKVFRRERGVGKMDDMQKRCGNVAKQWPSFLKDDKGDDEETPPPPRRGHPSR